MDITLEQFRQLSLGNVVETERKIGSGSYGEVVEVCVNGLKCAGKKLHGHFFDQSPEGQKAIMSRFVQECVT